jgi:hypothetical protein
VEASEFSDGQEVFNSELVCECVVVGHTNSWVEKFLIWGAEFRNWAKGYDVMVDIVSGLIIFWIFGSLVIWENFKGRQSKGESAKQDSA